MIPSTLLSLISGSDSIYLIVIDFRQDVHCMSLFVSLRTAYKPIGVAHSVHQYGHVDIQVPQVSDHHSPCYGHQCPVGSCHPAVCSALPYHTCYPVWLFWVCLLCSISSKIANVYVRPMDSECLCTNPEFQVDVGDCWMQYCTVAEQTAAFQLQASECTAS